MVYIHLINEYTPEIIKPTCKVFGHKEDIPKTFWSDLVKYVGYGLLDTPKARKLDPETDLSFA